MDSIEMRFVPAASTFQIHRPFRIPEIAQGLDEALPVVPSAWRHRYARERRERIDGLRHAIKHALRGCGPDAGQQMKQPEPGDAIPRVLDEPQQRQHVLVMTGVEKLPPADLYERNIPSR